MSNLTYKARPSIILPTLVDGSNPELIVTFRVHILQSDAGYKESRVRSPATEIYRKAVQLELLWNEVGEDRTVNSDLSVARNKMIHLQDDNGMGCGSF